MNMRLKCWRSCIETRMCSGKYVFINIACVCACINTASDCTITSPSYTLATLIFSLKAREKEFLDKVKKFFATCRAFYINNIP